MDSFPPLLPKCHGRSSSRVDSWRNRRMPRSGRTAVACTHCRKKKMKCDGGQPSCLNCVNFCRPCEYEKSYRSKEAWKSTVDDLERKNDKLEDIIRSLKRSSFAEAIERVQQLRGDVFPSPQSEELVSARSMSSSDKSISSSEWSPGVLTKDHNSTSFDVGYASNLPPEDITRHAISSFFSCGSTLFYVMSQEACENLISRIYEQAADVNKGVVCLLCAVAAVGSQYCADGVPDSAREKYFQHALLLLQDAIEEDTLISMRISVCLSVYLVLIKSTSARTMTASGLNIARWNLSKWMRNVSHADRLEWVKVLRTLAFTECWLSSTLGYPFDLRFDEIELIEDLAVSESVTNPGNDISSDLIRFYMYKMALLSAQVHNQVHYTTSLSKYELEQLSAKLDTWHKELPASLHLRSLTSSESTAACAKRPVLFMHMVHIASQINLYERVIQVSFNQSASISDKLAPCEMFHLPEDIHQLYGSFALQLARIVRLLYEEESVLRHCWLTIHSCFHSSLVLLLRAAQHLALGVCHESVLQNLSHVGTCLQVLGICEEQDIVAMQFLNQLVPAYQCLRQIVDNPALADKMDSTSSPPDSSPDIDNDFSISARLTHTIHQLVAATETRFQEIWV